MGNQLRTKRQREGANRSTNNQQSPGTGKSGYDLFHSGKEANRQDFKPNYPVSRQPSRKSDSTSKVYAARKLGGTWLPRLLENWVTSKSIVRRLISSERLRFSLDRHRLLHFLCLFLFFVFLLVPFVPSHSFVLALFPFRATIETRPIAPIFTDRPLRRALWLPSSLASTIKFSLSDD